MYPGSKSADCDDNTGWGQVPVPQDFMFLSLTFTGKLIKYSKCCRQLAHVGQNFDIQIILHSIMISFE